MLYITMLKICYLSTVLCVLGAIIAYNGQTAVTYHSFALSLATIGMRHTQLLNHYSHHALNAIRTYNFNIGICIV